MFFAVLIRPHSQNLEFFRLHVCTSIISYEQRLWLQGMRFGEVHIFRGWENPGYLIVGSTTRWIQKSSHASLGESSDRNRVSPSIQKGLLDMRRLAGRFARSSWSGILLFKASLYSLRVAVFCTAFSLLSSIHDSSSLCHAPVASEIHHNIFSYVVLLVFLIWLFKYIS